MNENSASAMHGTGIIPLGQPPGRSPSPSLLVGQPLPRRHCRWRGGRDVHEVWTRRHDAICDRVGDAGCRDTRGDVTGTLNPEVTIIVGSYVSA
jgi:hypothetical protein